MPTTTRKSAAGRGGLSDAAIIAASRRDPTRFAEIFDRHWPRIHRYCVSRAGAVGEDVAAETFRVALASLRRFDRTREDARPWLFGIATNLLRRNLRSESRRARALLRLHRDQEADLADGVLNRVEAEALGLEVAAALGRLPAAQRDALLLTAWGELTYEQVAEATGVSVGTVRTRIHRARASIRRSLQPEEALR
ncbi:MAG TPA: RNA polymerase sigma factor [Thermomicrobiaceae bacterium]|nr:RNA polymerase sigma factor [Thermomicrobiaceae bacterium]